MGKENDLRKLKREQLIDILCQQRDIIEQQQDRIEQLSQELNRLDIISRQGGIYGESEDRIMAELEEIKNLVRTSNGVATAGYPRSYEDIPDGNMLRTQNAIDYADEIPMPSNSQPEEIRTVRHRRARSVY